MKFNLKWEKYLRLYVCECVYANFVGVSSNYKLNVVHGISILALKSAKVNYNQRPVAPSFSLPYS